jgi:phenylpyruvate tautomerase PptA (4-oxalocrotonate tautomerase family)
MIALMPRVLIEVRRAYSPEQERGLIEAVHAALCEGFKIPPGDRNVRLVVHAPHRFAVPPSRERPDAVTSVTIEAFAGRSLDAKRQLYRAIVANLEPFGIPKDHVQIVLHEIPRENWGLRGGQAACDVDLGFKVDV